MGLTDQPPTNQVVGYACGRTVLLVTLWIRGGFTPRSETVRARQTSQHRGNAMDASTARRAFAGVALTGVCAVGLMFGPAAQAGSRKALLANTQTGKCLTIAGGVSTENNVLALQFDCDGHPSRSWMLDDMGDGTVQIRNVQTNKCLTIAGGVSTENNVRALQFNCDDHPSRRWILDFQGDGTYQIRNVQTRKCLTIAGGVSTENNVDALQFTCDDHPSRTWRIVFQGGGRIDDN
ncbi:RICIN domain-containing protein [Mycolicibacterium neworleansense]|nr:RICIN domain-containing protein [Mycolicibacterium neworleansense]